jgi:hypothetical protein
MEQVFRIFDFNVYNEKISGNDDSSHDEDTHTYKDSSQFQIQMFGLDESGKTCSIFVEDFKPFFYVMINDTWDMRAKNSFLEHLKQKIFRTYGRMDMCNLVCCVYWMYFGVLCVPDVFFFHYPPPK